MSHQFEHIYLGNLSATPITHSVYLHCERCNVSWTGCWDVMECEYCGRDCLHGSEHPDNPEGRTSRGAAPQIPLNPQALEKLKASIKDIEALGVKLGQIGVEIQAKNVASVNEAISKIKPISINFNGVTHD